MTEMTSLEFIGSVHALAQQSVVDVNDLDELCWKYLIAATKDYGRGGATAKKLLQIAKELMQ